MEWMASLGYSRQAIEMSKFLQKHYEKSQYYAGGEFRTKNQEAALFLSTGCGTIS